MSSNGFLNGPEIAVSFATKPLWHCRRQLFVSLGVNSAGDWYARTLRGLQPVLLLPNKSFWLKGFAGVTVVGDDGYTAVLWFLRRKCDAVAWRRLRAWTVHGQAGGG